MVKEESWGTRLGLILAMAGNAVGFGNFLRFPIQAIENGGGSFMIPYIVCFICLGIPLLLVEWATGRIGGSFGYHSTPFILHSVNKQKIWRYIGVFGLFSNLAIAAYYCYMESWTISYIYHSIMGTFASMNSAEVSAFFTSYHDISTTHSGIPYENLVFFILCLAINVYFLAKGLNKGVELVAKIAVPLLILFGFFLAYKGITITKGEDGAVMDGVKALEFLWTPNYTSLLSPKVWLAAAGQIFFTLSVGMGVIQCYASYIKKQDDIVLGSLSAGFLNEFVEIVLGGTILVSISIGFFGLDRVLDLIHSGGGFGLAFQSMPYLFNNWGPVIGAICGVCFFGLLFLAGITSSLAVGTPLVGFIKEVFKLTQIKSSLIVGILILILGLPTIFYFNEGVFDEYDFWAGTVSLFLFALCQAILFFWVYGLDNAWKEIHRGALIRLPSVYKFIFKYITPTMLILIFVSALITPKGNDWKLLSWRGWELDSGSIIGKIMNKDIGQNNTFFADELYAEKSGVLQSIKSVGNKYELCFESIAENNKNNEYTVRISNKLQLLIQPGYEVQIGDVVAKGHITNIVFYHFLARIILCLLFVSLLLMIALAFKKLKIE